MKKLLYLAMATFLLIGCGKERKDEKDWKETITYEDLPYGLPKVIKTKDGREAHLVIPDSNLNKVVYSESYNMTNRREKGVLTIYYNGYGDSIDSHFEICYIDTTYNK